MLVVMVYDNGIETYMTYRETCLRLWNSLSICYGF